MVIKPSSRIDLKKSCEFHVSPKVGVKSDDITIPFVLSAVN